MFKEEEQERSTLQQLTQTLKSLPHVRTDTLDVRYNGGMPDGGIDATLNVEIANKDVVLLVQIKRSVFPRDVRQLLWQLHKAREGFGYGRNVVPLVAAESVSEGARAVLLTENVGFFDAGGSLFIPAEGAYLYIQRPVPKAIEKSVRSLFSGKRSNVLHALLIKQNQWMGVNEISDIAHVSPSTASETLTALEKMEWVIARGQGPSKERRLANPKGLLDEWKMQIKASRKQSSRRRYYVPGGSNLTALAHRIAKVCENEQIEYVLTQEGAAQRYAPFLSSYSRLAIRIHPVRGYEQMLNDIEARSVSEGANVDVLETKSDGEFLFKKKVDDLWLASPVQVYLDLLRGEGRARDMAEHLRQELLGI